MADASDKGGGDGGRRGLLGDLPPSNVPRVPVPQVGGAGEPPPPPGGRRGKASPTSARSTAHGMKGGSYFQRGKVARDDLFDNRCPWFPEVDFVERGKFKEMETVAFIGKSLGSIRYKPRVLEGLVVGRYKHKGSDIENECIYLEVNFMFNLLRKGQVHKMAVPEWMAFHYKGN